MPCDVVNLSTVTDCSGTEGGIIYSFYVSAEYISAATFTAGVLSNLTMTAVGKIKRLDYNRDGVPYYNQTGQRNNKRLSYQQAAMMPFSGISKAGIDAASLAGSCCRLVFIHVLTSGLRVVQGMEVDTGAVGGFTGTKVRDTVLTPSILSDTSANEARMEFMVQGEARTPSFTTSLTDAAIAAL